ncbi:MAG: nuclear transport factor 2 family protein [Aliidongia sp.]
MSRDEELHAIEEIRQLKARYFRGVDTKDATVLRAVFTDGAETDFREESPDRDPALLQRDPDALSRTRSICWRDWSRCMPASCRRSRSCH